MCGLLAFLWVCPAYYRLKPEVESISSCSPVQGCVPLRRYVQKYGQSSAPLDRRTSWCLVSQVIYIISRSQEWANRLRARARRYVRAHARVGSCAVLAIDSCPLGLIALFVHSFTNLRNPLLIVRSRGRVWENHNEIAPIFFCVLDWVFQCYFLNLFQGSLLPCISTMGRIETILQGGLSSPWSTFIDSSPAFIFHHEV